MKIGLNLLLPNNANGSLRLMFLRTLLAVSALMFYPIGQMALAECVIPVGPTVTRSDGVLTLHSYAEGFTLCIDKFDRKNSCALCRKGYFHECKAGYWRPQHWRDCEPHDSIQPAQSGGPQPQGGGLQPQGGGGAGGGGSDALPPGDGSHQPNQDLCKLLGTCP